jgi:8-oxo-dGTP pyrophosphatase MutT (NUDIX family)
VTPTSQPFDRDNLIALLRAYTPIDSADDDSRQQILAFVESHEDFHRRSYLAGHVTASAWIVNEATEYVLLTRHGSLDRWMQLGGHIEEDANIIEAALREATEESGLSSLRLRSPEAFDLDVHPIPLSPKAPAHVHYDVRFCFVADRSEPFTVSSESKSLAWVKLGEVADLTSERSVLRMVEKTGHGRGVKP